MKNEKMNNLIRYFTGCLFIISFVATYSLASAASNTPEGRWLTFDENNGDTLAIVEISRDRGFLVGHIKKVFLRPHQGPKGICARCPDERQNRSLIGLTILQGFEKDGSSWSGGEILNPPDGKIYSARVELATGRLLKLQISYGPFGVLKTTRTWRRAPGDSTGDSPAGIWEVYDQRFDSLTSVVEIREQDGRLQGRILQTFLMPDEGPQARCVACKDSLKNQPIAGLQIISGLSRDGDKWSDGTILDPGNGKTYRCSLQLDGNDRLKVRGHLGPFTRTQTWQRLVN